MRITLTILTVLTLLVTIAAINGCSDPNEVTTEMKIEKITPTVEVQKKAYSRFEVTRVSKFSDSLAYDGERGIYIIKDKETGVEYVGVSGIGISELGAHQAGKVRKADER